ncbi:LysM peptidoglycan-binding domain-containing protein [Pedobacter arcticus]|uniref:LysM peptidoglycan-binding domain-containing protein n=1 Tax=Pedobacter arcticus TaxID=752140 RepID=UPI0002DD4355|nr:LysM peptidoglycan-binding domain-containing protein [Pedobacter arcticus]
MIRLSKFIALSFIFIGLTTSSEASVNRDSLTYASLSLKEFKAIKKLVNADTSLVPAQTNLQLEVLKYKPNLIYKYRLDSIRTEFPLDYNPFVQTYIDIFLDKRSNEMGQMLALGRYYFPVFEKALQAYNIPSEFKYLPIIESSMNPMAISRVGATGMWQFMYTTARMYDLTIDNYVDERRDPTEASYAAARYLRDAYNNLGDWMLALASYNCGVGCVNRAIAKAGGSRNFWDIQAYLPSETRNYVPAFIATAYVMNYYPKHPQVKVPDEKTLRTDSISVNKFMSFDKIAKALNIDAEDLRGLNPVYKKNIINGTIAEPKRLIIPKLSFKDYAGFFEAFNAEEDGSLKMLSASELVKPNLKIANTHIVKKGETLTAIADKYRVEVQDIKVWNSLSNYTIAVGQQLVIRKEAEQLKPKKETPTYITYKVKAGDNLVKIAERFENVSVSTLKVLNNLESSVLTIGMVLKIATH